MGVNVSLCPEPIRLPVIADKEVEIVIAIHISKYNR